MFEQPGHDLVSPWLGGIGRSGYLAGMTQTPGEPISDSDAPTGDPDLTAEEQPDPATEPHESEDQVERTVDPPPDADEGDPNLSSHPG
jgi:hypothetical protein